MEQRMAPHLVLVHPGFVPPAGAPPPPDLLPRCVALEAQTACLCGGLLAYLAGEWRHVNICLDCLDAARPGCYPRHRGCPTPEPVACTHLEDWRCDQPVALTGKCAHARPDGTCCLCCWITEVDDPS
jgi:hypothetical protein